jgi:predicted flap endonuclease-1-like 5' DNA nuclease
MPVDPVIVAGAVGGLSVAAAAIYAYTTGEDASASVDVDDDGTDEASVSFEGKENDPVETDTASAPPNPTPDEVIDKSGLTDIKGIQETRAKNLGMAGFSTPADVYYASDENLEEVDQIGPYTVEQIREDIGSVDDDPNGKSNEEASDDSQDFTDQTEADNQSESSQSEQEAE